MVVPSTVRRPGEGGMRINLRLFSTILYFGCQEIPEASDSRFWTQTVYHQGWSWKLYKVAQGQVRQDQGHILRHTGL